MLRRCDWLSHASFEVFPSLPFVCVAVSYLYASAVCCKYVLSRSKCIQLLMCVYVSAVAPSSHTAAVASSPQTRLPHWWTWPGRAWKHRLLWWRGSRLIVINSVLYLLFTVILMVPGFAFGALLLLVGWQEGHLTCKKTEWWGADVIICLGQGAHLHIAHIDQLIPLPLTVSWSSKSRLVYKGPLNGCCCCCYLVMVVP